MDVSEHYRARADLEKAFEEIKRLRDQLHDEKVVLREQIDQAFMFEENVGTSSVLFLFPLIILCGAHSDAGTGSSFASSAATCPIRSMSRTFHSYTCLRATRSQGIPV
jgi:hypothetical protein